MVLYRPPSARVCCNLAGVRSTARLQPKTMLGQGTVLYITFSHDFAKVILGAPCLRYESPCTIRVLLAVTAPYLHLPCGASVLGGS